MSNLLSQISVYKSKVLRLKDLLDVLRHLCRAVLPENPTINDVSKKFDIDWAIARRFWVQGKAGGEQAIRKICGVVSSANCEEIVDLINELPDNYKTLVQYPVPAISLAFDVFEAYRIAGKQTDPEKRNQLTVEQFISVFPSPDSKKFVQGIASRNLTILADYTDELGDEIRRVIYDTDWENFEKPVRNQAQVHEPEVQLEPRKAKEVTRDNVRPDAIHHTSAFISLLNAGIKMVETSGVGSDAFTDGQRDNLIRIMIKIMTLAKVDSAAIKRILKTEGLSANDPALSRIFSALGDKR